MRVPLVSILVPTYNSAKYLAEALYSIATLDYPSIELVVVDGGSTDETLSIVEQFAEGETRIVRSEGGKGLGYDLNVGLAACTGAFIARMDADDVCKEFRIADQVRFLLANSHVDLVATGADTFGDSVGCALPPETHQEIRDMYLVNNPFFHPTVMVRRSIVDSGLFRYDPEFRADEDYELWGRLIPHIQCGGLQWASIKYRLHGSNAQREPWKYRYKKLALERFCNLAGVHNPDLVVSLTEFQCSQFITPRMYAVMAQYARVALQSEKDAPERPGGWLPKLGWLQAALIEARGYADFMKWYSAAKGWRLG